MFISLKSDLSATHVLELGVIGSSARRYQLDFIAIVERKQLDHQLLSV
jgi:hypothetical protein